MPSPPLSTACKPHVLILRVGAKASARRTIWHSYRRARIAVPMHSRSDYAENRPTSMCGDCGVHVSRCGGQLLPFVLGFSCSKEGLWHTKNHSRQPV